MSLVNSIAPVLPRTMHEPLNRLGNKLTMVNDFGRILHNSNGEFLTWDFTSLTTRFGQHTLFVEEGGSIKYESGGFTLAENTALRYNLTPQFPKKNIAIKMKINTQVNDVTIDLAGFHCRIQPLINGGKIEYKLTYEDDTFTLFPQLLGYANLIENFSANDQIEYLFYIDIDNNELFCAINGVMLATNPFDSLKNIKITNLKILTGVNGDVKISDLTITETNVATPPTIVAFSLRLLLIFDSLVFYNMTNPSTRDNLTLSDNSPNNSVLSITKAPYLFSSYFDFKNHSDSIIQGPINNVGGVLGEISINFWFFIKNKNVWPDGEEQPVSYQPIIVLGPVDTGSTSITLSLRGILRLDSRAYTLHFNHFPYDIDIPENAFIFQRNVWYNVVFSKSALGVYNFHINGNIVPVWTKTVDRVITIPANTVLSLGKDWNRPDQELQWARIGLVSIYERLLTNEELKSLYDEYKGYYLNIPLLSDAIGVWDLTEPENISYSIPEDKFNITIKDKSGNDNELVELGRYELEYVNNNSIKFKYANNALGANLKILHGNIQSTINIWILVNKQATQSIEKQRIYTLGSGETSGNSSLSLSLVCTDTVSYALEFGSAYQYIAQTDKVIFPDVWYNITVTRNDVGDTILYIDAVKIQTLRNNINLNVDEFFSIGKYFVGHTTEYIDLKTAQIGTISIYERALNETEVSTLYSLYNISYLLNNSIIDAKVTDWNNDGSDLLVSDSTFFGNAMSLYNVADSYDGISFEIKDTGGEPQQINNLFVAGMNDPKFPHTFNVWFKLSPDAEGMQQIIAYGEDYYNNRDTRPHVIYRFSQVIQTYFHL